MTTSHNESASELQQIEDIEHQIDLLRLEQAQAHAQAKEFLQREDPARGICFHAEIFRLQQDRLRLDTEIQFLQVKLRRLKAVW